MLSPGTLPPPGYILFGSASSSTLTPGLSWRTLDLFAVCPGLPPSLRMPLLHQETCSRDHKERKKKAMLFQDSRRTEMQLWRLSGDHPARSQVKLGLARGRGSASTWKMRH